MANTFALAILKEFEPNQQNEMLSHVKSVIASSRAASINSLEAESKALSESLNALNDI